MKKVLPALAALLAVAAGGAGLYVAQQSGGLHLTRHPTTADYLPAETLVLLALPDPGKSLENWKTTDLYKIWAEPQVQAFLAKPLSKIPANPSLDSAWTQVAALDPKNLFIALTALDEKDSRPHVIGGFQFKGSKEDVERLLATPKKQLRDSDPASKADLINYQSHAIETLVGDSKDILAATYVGDWYLLSNDVALLKATLDRVDHRTPDSQPSLSKDADFQAVAAKLPSSYETLIFGRAQPFLSRLYALAAASGQAVDPERRAESDKVKAIGATTRIESGKIRDTIYSLAPGLKQDGARLQMSSLPLSSPETLFYLASVIQLPAKFDLPASDANAANVGGMAAVQEILAGLASRGITLEAMRAAFGGEGALQLDWPAANLQPSILASIEVRDQGAAQKMVDQLTSAPLNDLSWETKQANGRTYHSLNVPSLSMFQPTLTLTDKHLLFGLDAPQVRDAAAREGGSSPTFTASDAYKAANALVDKPNAVFAYLDTKTMFEKTYGLLRPYAIMGAAFLPPQSAEYIDLGKLPDTETISKHLAPSVLSQTIDKDGVKLDSVGSVTFAQGAVGLTGASSAIAFAMFPKSVYEKFLPSSSTAPAQLAPPADATPSASDDPGQGKGGANGQSIRVPAPMPAPVPYTPAVTPKAAGAEGNTP